MAVEGFTVQLERFAAKAKARGPAVVRKVVLEMGTSLVFRSPVGDGSYWLNPPPKGYVGGRFRANWQVGLGSINYTVSDKTDADGAATVGNLFAKVADADTEQVFYLTNSLPYAKRIEDGWSRRQAPQGVVALTVLQFRQFISAAVSEVKSEQ